MAKPEVEIWRRPHFWTFRPRLPIRPPIHYGVYLAPLRSCHSELLPLRHYNGRRTAKIFQVRRAFLPNSSAHCSNCSRQNFTKFSGSLESPSSCRKRSKNPKSDDRVPSKSRPKFAKKPNLKPPYLPQIGADSPQIKTVFLRVASTIRRMGRLVDAGPKRG